MPRITADEAARIIHDEQRALQAVNLPPTLSRIRVLMQEEAFPICNVGPWSYRIERGCFQMLIPAYSPEKDPEKKGYTESAPIPTIRREAAQTMLENDYKWIEQDGHTFARDLIGIGPGLPLANALTQYGVFVPAGTSPTKAEIAEARRNLELYVDRLIAEARDAYDLGPEERKNVITDRHIWAARRRGLDEKWVHHQHTQESVRCDMCGKYNPTGIAKCSCGRILDYELFQKLEAEQARMLEGKTPKGK